MIAVQVDASFISIDKTCLAGSCILPCLFHFVKVVCSYLPVFECDKVKKKTLSFTCGDHIISYPIWSMAPPISLELHEQMVVLKWNSICQLTPDASVTVSHLAADNTIKQYFPEMKSENKVQTIMQNPVISTANPRKCPVVSCRATQHMLCVVRNNFVMATYLSLDTTWITSNHQLTYSHHWMGTGQC